MRGTLRQLRRLERVCPIIPRAWVEPSAEAVSRAIETAAGEPLPYLRMHAREIVEPLARRFPNAEAKAQAWDFYRVALNALIFRYTPAGSTTEDFTLDVQLELRKLADAAAEAGQ